MLLWFRVVVCVCVLAVTHLTDIPPHSPLGAKGEQADGRIQVHRGLTYGPRRRGLCLCPRAGESHSDYA